MHDSGAAAFLRTERIMNQPRVMSFVERINAKFGVASRMSISRGPCHGFKFLAMLNQDARSSRRTEFIGQISSHAARISKEQQRLPRRIFPCRFLQRLLAPSNLIEPAARIDRGICRAATT